MGKRSSFERAPRDFYPTPAEAVTPLLAHLPAACRMSNRALVMGDWSII